LLLGTDKSFNLSPVISVEGVRAYEMAALARDVAIEMAAATATWGILRARKYL
jgi:hypothetical protein